MLLLLSGTGSDATETTDSPPGAIKLLPDYTHQTQQGIDTRMGKIFKKGGLTIQYDIGFFAGNYAGSQQKNQRRWYKEQIINGQTVQLVRTKDRTLCVTFVEHSANFYAKVKTEEDIADVLLMVLTYTPTEKAR